MLFDRFNILTFEEGTPDNKFAAQVNWNLDRWGATLRAHALRRSAVARQRRDVRDCCRRHACRTTSRSARRRWSTSKAAFDITDNIRVALGAENLLDEYPDPNTPNANPTGTTSFSNYSPFGRSGRFVYGRVSYKF